MRDLHLNFKMIRLGLIVVGSFSLSSAFAASSVTLYRVVSSVFSPGNSSSPPSYLFRSAALGAPMVLVTGDTVPYVIPVDAQSEVNLVDVGTISTTQRDLIKKCVDMASAGASSGVGVLVEFSGTKSTTSTSSSTTFWSGSSGTAGYRAEIPFSMITDCRLSSMVSAVTDTSAAPTPTPIPVTTGGTTSSSSTSGGTRSTSTGLSTGP